MTQKYKDILDKLKEADKHGFATEQMKSLISILESREDMEIDKLLEDKGNLRVILRSYY